MEALIDSLTPDLWISEVWIQDNVTVGVFFSNRISVKLIQRYNTVFLMDCTYQTNRYGMPLLNIVGVTCTNTTFNAAFAFISNEVQESYEWALQNFKKIVNPQVICTDREMALMNSIKAVFPQAKNVLCSWHINKNLLANCKSFSLKRVIGIHLLRNGTS
jgi:hypothetical protein